jgi:DNA-binding Lrp family transcriptional regulator
MEVCDDPIDCDHNHKISRTEPEVLEAISQFTSMFNSQDDFDLLQTIVEEGTSSKRELAEEADMTYQKTRDRVDRLRELGLRPQQVSHIQWNHLPHDGKYSLNFRNDEAAALYLLEPAVGAKQVARESEIYETVANEAARKSEVAEGVYGAGYLLSEEAHYEWRFLESLVGALQSAWEETSEATDSSKPAPSQNPASLQPFGSRDQDEAGTENPDAGQNEHTDGLFADSKGEEMDAEPEESSEGMAFGEAASSQNSASLQPFGDYNQDATETEVSDTEQSDYLEVTFADFKNEVIDTELEEELLEFADWRGLESEERIIEEFNKSRDEVFISEYQAMGNDVRPSRGEVSIVPVAEGVIRSDYLAVLPTDRRIDGLSAGRPIDAPDVELIAEYLSSQ